MQIFGEAAKRKATFQGTIEPIQHFGCILILSQSLMIIIKSLLRSCVELV